MITIDVSKTINDIRNGLAPVTDKELRKSVARSINRTIESGRTQLKREASAIYNLKVSDSKNELPLRRARSSELVGKIMARTSMIPIEKFNPTIKTETVTTKVKRRIGSKRKGYGAYNAIYSTGNKTNKKQGVYVTILRSRGRQRIPSAFLLFTGKWAGKVSARGRYNRDFDFIFRRKRIEQDGHDFPIGNLKGLSILSAVTNKSVLKRIEPEMVKTFSTRLTHEIQQSIANRK